MELWDVYDRDRKAQGRTHVRGVPMRDGDYHLVVHIWILNAQGEYLISKRTPNKTYPNLWECTGGSAVTGDDSLTAALREVREELGMELDPLNGKLILSRLKGDAHEDVWLFRQNVRLSDIICQRDETSGAKWAAPDEIRRMCAAGEFVPVFDYLEWLFAYEEPLAFFPKQNREPTYAVIAARYAGRWLMVRHRDRHSWEFPGGHVAEGELPLDAARRELVEESGAKAFSLWPVCEYSVARGAAVSSGLLCYAEIDSFDDLLEAFEMAERRAFERLPEALTYPDIIPKLLARAQRWIDETATRVYFVRHAESDQTVHQDDIRPLTAKGLADADALVDALHDVRLDAIYSSPYLRAEQTVLPLARDRRLPVFMVPEFRERKVGGGWIDDYESFARAQWADVTYKLADGESIGEAQKRNIDALNRILLARPGQSIAVGTHGGCLSAIMKHYDPAFGHEQFCALLPKLPCVIRMDFIGKTRVGMCELPVRLEEICQTH